MMERLLRQQPRFFPRVDASKPGLTCHIPPTEMEPKQYEHFFVLCHCQPVVSLRQQATHDFLIQPTPRVVVEYHDGLLLDGWLRFHCHIGQCRKCGNIYWC